MSIWRSRACSAYNSATLMKLQGRNLSANSPLQLINYSIILSMITIELSNGDIKVRACKTSVARLCFRTTTYHWTT